MHESILYKSAQNFKAVKGLLFMGEPSLWTPIVTYHRDQITDFSPGKLDLPGGDTDALDPDVFMAFQRKLHEEFGMHVMRARVIGTHVHEGQPQATDLLRLPSLLLAATIDVEEAGDAIFRPGDEGTEHGAMPLIHFLSRTDTMPVQKTRVLQLIGNLGLFKDLEN